jgi:hypothetical protein
MTTNVINPGPLHRLVGLTNKGAKNEYQRVWDAGYETCRQAMNMALKRSGDIDLTTCTGCGLPCFVSSNDGLCMCNDCEKKKSVCICEYGGFPWYEVTNGCPVCDKPNVKDQWPGQGAQP